MGWKDTAKEKAQEHIVLGLFGLIVLLLLVIWRAVPSSVWGTVSEVVPTQVLWALIALELIVIGLLIAFALDNKRRLKTAPVPEPPPKPLRRFNVHWDSDICPLCPLCNVTLPMTDSGAVSGKRYEIFGCPKCRTMFRLYDDSGNLILLNQAIIQIRNDLAASARTTNA